MKKLLLLLLTYGACLFALKAYAQCTTPVQNLIENFNSQPDPNNRAIIQDCWSIYYPFVDRGREVGSIQANGTAIAMNSTYGAALIFPSVQNLEGNISFKAVSNNGKVLELGYYSGSSFNLIKGFTMGSSSTNIYTHDLANSGIASHRRLAFRFATNTGSLINLTLDDVTYKSFCKPAADPTALAKDFTAKLDATGNVIVNPSSLDNGSKDTCGEFITNFSLDKTLFTCDNLGVNTVILTATDSEGQTATATANITVEPSFVFNSNGLALDKNGVSTVALEFLTKSKTDCSAVTFTLDKTDFTCADAGNYTFTVTASYNGLSKTFSATKSIRDFIDPKAITKDIAVSIDASTGLAVITPAMINNSSIDNCGIETFSISKASFDCADQGENTVILTVTDKAGRSSTANAIVTVNSFIPDVNVASDNTAICFDGESTSNATITTDGSMLGAKYSLRKASDSTVVDGPIDGTGNGLSFNTGTVNKNTTYQVFAEVPFAGKALDLTDNGRKAHLSVNTPGSFDYSKGYTLSAWVKLGSSGNSTFYNGVFYAGGATGSDIEIYESSNGSLTVVHNRGNGGAQGSYVISGDPITNNTYVHFSATYDGRVSRIFVNGVEKGAKTLVAPTKSASSEITVGYLNSTTFPAAQSFPGIVDDIRVYDKALTATDILVDYDKCLTTTKDNLVLYYDLESISGSIYTDMVNSTPAQVKNGGFSSDVAAISCSFTCNRIMSKEIIVGDNIAPTVIAKNITVKHDGTGNTNVDPADLNNGSKDNCTTDEKLTFSLDKFRFSCDALGAQQVVLTATDEAGNTATANATITLDQFIVDEKVTVLKDALCPGDSTTVSIPASQINANYYLRDADNKVIEGPIVGTGKAIDFKTGVVNKTTIYNVFAESNVKNEAFLISGGYLSMANSSSLQLDSNWTMETWIKPLAGNSDYFFIESYDANGGFVIRGTRFGKIQAYAMNSSRQNSNVISSTSYVANKWTHIAATFNETTNELKIYINGVLDATNSNATVDQRGPKTTVKIGARGDDNRASPKHEQDEVRIWNMARSAKEIKDNMSKGLSGQETGLVSYHNFNKLTFVASEMKISDLTSNSNEATIVGGYSKSNFTDDALNVSQTCSLQMTTTVTVKGGDEIKPNVITQNYTLVLGSETSASITTTDIDNGSTDDCTAVDDLKLSLDITSFNNTQIGDHTVTLTVEDKTGNSNSATAIVTVTDKTPQTVTFDAISDKVFGDPNFEITASVNTELPIVFSVQSGPVTISDGTVTITGAGQVTIRASQAGNETFAPAQLDRIFNIAKADQSLTVEAITNKTVAALPITIGASISTELALEYSIVGPASIVDNIVTLDGTIGAIMITISQSGNNNYNAISKTIDFEVVAQTSQVITFTTIGDKTYGDDAFDLNASSDSELAVSLSLISGPATLSGSILTITGIGEVIVEAAQAGDVTFSKAVSVRETFTVAKVALTITADAQVINYGDAIPTLTFQYVGFVNAEDATALISEPAINTAADASSDAGSYVIELTGGEAMNYNIALVVATLTINQLDQLITIDPITDKEPTDAAFDIAATTDSGLELSYEITGPATVTGTTITLDGSEGTVTLTVSQVGDVNHNSAAASQSFEVVVILALNDGLSDGINIYPNPVSEVLKIETEQSINGTIRLYNIRGIEVLNSNFNSLQNQINVTSLPKGLYILTIQDEDSAMVKRQTIIISE